MACIGILACSGFFRGTATQPFRLLVVLIPAICFCIYSYRKLNTTAENLKYLFGLHLLRIPVEIVLYQLFLQKQLPELMTFSGWNFDIVSGITAALLLLYILASGKQPNPKLFFAWNIMGVVLLAIIVLLAILSAPAPFQQFAFAQPNVAVLAFPYTLLPAYIVPAVLASHLLTFKLLHKAKD